MKTAIERLQGSWSITSLEVDGQVMPSAMLSQAGIEVKGDRFITTAMGAVYEGVIAVNEAVTPHQLDLVFTAGPEKGNRSLAIFKLRGDRWTLCLTVSGRTRPMAFATSPGSGHALEILQKIGGKNPPAKPVLRETPPPTVLQTRDGMEGEWAMLSGFMDGHALEASLVKVGRRIAIDGETTTIFGSQIFMKARYAIDESCHPAAIDYQHVEGMNAGKTQQGIYELTATRLRIAMAAPGAARPSDFSAEPGDGRTVTEWRRVGVKGLS